RLGGRQGAGRGRGPRHDGTAVELLRPPDREREHGAMGRVTSRVRGVRIEHGVRTDWVDTLVAEEPLEIRLDGEPLAVAVRTPGADFDLVAGFLVGEGVLTGPEQLGTIRYCAGATSDGRNTYNVLDVTLAGGVPRPELNLQRNFYTSSSCGICGKAS